MYSQIESNKRKTWVLITVFAVVVLLAGAAFGYYTDLGYFGLIFAAIFTLGMSLFSYYKGDKVALASAGAKEIGQKENPYVYRMVENLSITSGLPMPRVHIIEDSNINAFATGRDPEHASVAVTTGAIEKLENEELEGVLAHEMSHIKNYDIRVMTLVIILVGLLVLMSNWFLRITFWGGGRRDSNKGGGQLQVILMVVGLVLLILSPIIARLIQFAVSRKREYLADASGSLMTRYPEGLARALEKIEKENVPMKRANNATAHLYIASPFAKTKKHMARLFNTHPPIQDRVAKLRSMA